MKPIAFLPFGCRRGQGNERHPEFQAQMTQQFTEMDYLDGPQWRERLKQDEARLRRIGAGTPWVE